MHMDLNMDVNRRDALAFGVGMATSALALSFGLPAHATPGKVNGRLAELADGDVPQTGRIRLNAPEIAENGNTVPVSVEVESAMSGDDLVESVTLLADGNPNPEVATFHFTALSGAARANTRLRLAKTQNVFAVARMADGSTFMDSKLVKVTIGGCGG